MVLCNRILQKTGPPALRAEVILSRLDFFTFLRIVLNKKTAQVAPLDAVKTRGSVADPAQDLPKPQGQGHRGC